MGAITSLGVCMLLGGGCAVYLFCGVLLWWQGLCAP
jgi:hypothetical protein